MDYARNIDSTKRSSHPYVDEYTGFTWNNIHSSRYNCFIENTGHLSFEPAPAFSNNFINPQFQNRNYYTGMQMQTKKVQLNLVFYQLTLADLNEALLWLDPTVISSFFFDYEPYWKYTCKLASIGTMEKYVDGCVFIPVEGQNRPVRKDLYIGRVQVTFETVYQTDAVSIYTVLATPLDAGQIFNVVNANPESSEERLDFATNTDELLIIGVDEASTDVDPNNFLEGYNNSNYFAPESQDPEQWPLVTGTYVKAADCWNLTLKNPSMKPVFFKLHLYDVEGNIKVEATRASNQNSDDVSYAPGGPIDVKHTPNTIVQATLLLDDEHKISLHYNSEDGSLLTADQSVEVLQGFERHNICDYANALSNIMVPPAQNGVYGKLFLNIYGVSNWCIEYDLYNYMM